MKSTVLDELTIGINTLKHKKFELVIYTKDCNQFEFFFHFLTKYLFLFKLVEEGLPKIHIMGFVNASQLECISCLLISLLFYNYRDKFSDYLLAVIKDAMNLYPHLKLILMSATMNAQLFL